MKCKRKFLPLDHVKRIFPTFVDRAGLPIAEEGILVLAGISPDLMGLKDEVERAKRVTYERDLSSSVVIREYNVSSQAGNGAWPSRTMENWEISGNFKKTTLLTFQVWFL